MPAPPPDAWARTIGASPALQAVWSALAADRRLAVRPGDLVAIQQLLARRPELEAPERREELAGAVAAVLATSRPEWERIARIVRGEAELEVASPPIAAPAFRLLDRVLAGIGVVLLVGLLAFLGYLIAQSESCSPVVDTGARDGAVPEAGSLGAGQAGPGAAAEDARRDASDADAEPDAYVPTFVVLTSSTPTVAPSAAGLRAAPPASIAGVLAVAVGLGVLAAALAGYLRLRREQQDLARSSAAALAALKAEASQATVTAYPRATRHPIDPELADRTRQVVSRIRASLPSSALDPHRTVQESVRVAGAALVVVRRPRRAPVPVTVLVDEETRGTHAFLPEVWRWLEEWAALDPDALDVYVYRNALATLTPLGRREDVALQELARGARGPLLVVSRGLRAEGGMGGVDGLGLLQAWPRRAWLDPDPASEGRPAAQMAALARAGFRRFPMTPEHVAALLEYLAGGADSVAERHFPPLPQAPSALALWRGCAAMSPFVDADLLEALRAGMPEIARAFPRRTDVRVLLSALDVELVRGGDYHHGDGRDLWMRSTRQLAWMRDVPAEAKDRARTILLAGLLRAAEEETHAVERAMKLAMAQKQRVGLGEPGAVEALLELAGEAPGELIASELDLERQAHAGGPSPWEDGRLVSAGRGSGRVVASAGLAALVAVVALGLGTWAVRPTELRGWHVVRELRPQDRVAPEVAPTPPSAVVVSFRSVPEGAQVYAGDGLLGTTPFEQEMARAAAGAPPRAFMMRKAGFRDEAVDARLDRAAVVVEARLRPVVAVVARADAGTRAPDAEVGFEDGGPSPSPTVTSSLTAPPSPTPVARPPREATRWRPAMVRAPKGRFTMGSPATEVGRNVDEAAHEVEIAQAFYIGVTEVTQAQWVAVMGKNPSKHWGAERPVENVSWFDATEYLNRLSEKEGLESCYARERCWGDPAAGGSECAAAVFAWASCSGYRLPTEAEWEYAARARTSTPFYGAPVDGANDTATREALERIAWFSDNSDLETHPVGRKVPNAWGLYDVIGNVWEWVDGRLPGTSVVVSRGCGFDDYHARRCRAAFRDGDSPAYRYRDLGFRPARSAFP